MIHNLDELATQSGIRLPAIAAHGRQADTYGRLIAAMQSMNIPVRTLNSGVACRFATRSTSSRRTRAAW
jgi:hypothetical protein